MEGSKSSDVKQTQGGDDSGYSCSSTQSINSGKWLYEESNFFCSTLLEITDSCGKTQPFWMEDIVQSPDLIFRYQIEHRDINEVLKEDMKTLNTFSQPLLDNDQFRQLYEEIDVYGDSKSTCSNDGSSESCGDKCLISIGLCT